MRLPRVRSPLWLKICITAYFLNASRPSRGELSPLTFHLINMIFTLDIGNSNIKLGVFDKNKLLTSYKISSSVGKTADEYCEVFVNLLTSASIGINNIEGIIISSVKPSLNFTVERAVRHCFKKSPLIVSAKLKTNLKINTDNPEEVGADRLCDCVAALMKYKRSAIIASFGTATVFNVLTAKGEFLGGVIAPGMKGSLDSLVNSAAKLPNIEIKTPPKVIAEDTVTNMQAGIVFGFTGLTEYIVARIKKELNDDNALVIATGGFADIIAGETKVIDIVDKTLTLDGLNYLYQINK